MRRTTILQITLLLSFTLFNAALSTNAKAEEAVPNGIVRTWTDGTVSPKATLNDVRWLQGDWEGKLDEAMQQYMVFAPVSGHMPGFARAWGPDGAIWFYEINDFVEVNGSLEFHVKHFSGELSGWEGKDEFVRHRLIAIAGNTIYFDGLTIVREGADHHTVYVRIVEGDRKGTIVIVHQTRVVKR